jgi:diacylglycerol kinase family enzyme
MSTPDAPVRRALVVVNPTAARLTDPERRAKMHHELVRDVIERTGLAPDWVEGGHAEAKQALADIADRPLVVVAGGDGTVREAVDALRGTDVPLAIVPGGTGNVLAHALRIGGLAPALRAILHGSPVRLDLGLARWGDASGTAGERLFAVACGMGFDARIMAAAEHEWKRRLRFGAYVGAAVREAARLQPAVFRIEADGVESTITGIVALVANCGDIVPGRVGPRRPLDPTDGKLDLMVVGGTGLLSGLRGAADLLLRDGDQDGSVIRRLVSRVRIEADPPQPVETDGDPHDAGWLEAEVVPGAILVLEPPP